MQKPIDERGAELSKLGGVARADLIEKAGRLYEAINPQAALTSRATFLLLSALALIGLSLASSKPQTVQVLGFTLQAEHWIYLAGPLALVVCYSLLLLTISWRVEVRRYNYLVVPLKVEFLGAIRTANEKLIRDEFVRPVEGIAAEQLSSSRLSDRYSLDVNAQIDELDAEVDMVSLRLRGMERAQIDAANAREGYGRPIGSEPAGTDEISRQIDLLREKLHALKERRAKLGSDFREHHASSRASFDDHGRGVSRRIQEMQDEELPHYRDMRIAAELNTKLSARMIGFGFYFPAAFALGACGVFVYMAFKGYNSL